MFNRIKQIAAAATFVALASLTLSAEQVPDPKLIEDLHSLNYPSAVKSEENADAGSYGNAAQVFEATRDAQLDKDLALYQGQRQRYEKLIAGHEENARKIEEVLTGGKLNTQLALAFIREQERGSDKEVAARNILATKQGRQTLQNELESRLQHERSVVAYFQRRLGEVDRELARLREEKQRRNVEASVLGDDAFGVSISTYSGNEYSDKIAGRETAAYEEAEALAGQMVSARTEALLKTMDLTVPSEIGSEDDPQHPLQILLKRFDKEGK